MGEQEHMGGGERQGRPGPHKQREASVLGGRVVEVAERDCLLQGPVTPSPSARTSQGAGKNRGWRKRGGTQLGRTGFSHVHGAAASGPPS